VLVVFPFTAQLGDAEALGIPQRRVLAHAREHGVAALDLLGPLAERTKGEASRVSELFLDTNHLTPAGCRFVAELIAAQLLQPPRKAVERAVTSPADAKAGS